MTLEQVQCAALQGFINAQFIPTSSKCNITCKDVKIVSGMSDDLPIRKVMPGQRC